MIFNFFLNFILNLSFFKSISENFHFYQIITFYDKRWMMIMIKGFMQVWIRLDLIFRIKNVFLSSRKNQGGSSMLLFELKRNTKNSLIWCQTKLKSTKISLINHLSFITQWSNDNYLTVKRKNFINNTQEILNYVEMLINWNRKLNGQEMDKFLAIINGAEETSRW